MRWCHGVSILLAVLLVLGSVPGALAQAKHDHAHDKAAGHAAKDGHGAKDGHDAKDGHGGHGDKAGGDNIFAGLLDLTLWTIVVFVVLLIVLSRMAWAPMMDGLKRREENINAAIEESKMARAEAAQLRASIDSERAKIGEEMRKALDDARRQGQQLVDELQSKARGEIQADRDRLRKEITTAKDQALQELWSHAAELATLVSAKAIRRQLSQEDHRRLIDEALAEMKTAGANHRAATASVH
jgi:F-type H+-transporting ATPase subunit b